MVSSSESTVAELLVFRAPLLLVLLLRSPFFSFTFFALELWHDLPENENKFTIYQRSFKAGKS